MRRRAWAILLAVPLLLSGCSALDTLTGRTPATAPSPAPSGTSWIVVAPGSAAPSPVPSFTASPRTMATGFLPLPKTGVIVTPRPTSTCGRAAYDFSRINGLTVVPGPTSAKVSFYNIGGYNLVQFRLTAIDQDLTVGKQRDAGWVTITPTAPCGQITATITGLTRRTGYVFSVDAVVTRRSGAGTHAATVFRSHVVRTT